MSTQSEGQNEQADVDVPNVVQEAPSVSEEELKGIVKARTLSKLFNGAATGAVLGILGTWLGFFGTEPSVFMTGIAVVTGLGAAIGGFSGAADGYKKVQTIREKAINQKLKGPGADTQPKNEP